MGRWWIGDGEWRLWRVETADGGELELLYDMQTRRWRLYRVYD